MGKYFENHDKYNNIIKAIIFITILTVMATINVKDYMEYRDRVIKVKATVVDSLNYVNSIKGSESYNSRAVLAWEKDGKSYSGNVLLSGTVLTLETLDITVLKEDPSVIKNISFSNVLGSVLFTVFILVAILIAFNIERIYKRIVKVHRKENNLYKDIGEENLCEGKEKGRKKWFLILVSLGFLLAFSGVFLDVYKDYKIERGRKEVYVNLLVLKVFDLEDETIVIGSWERDGQVYKKELHDLSRDFKEGESYTIKVLEDTKESRGLSTVPRVKSMIIFLSGILVSFISLFYGLFNKREGENNIFVKISEKIQCIIIKIT